MLCPFKIHRSNLRRVATNWYAVHVYLVILLWLLQLLPSRTVKIVGCTASLRDLPPFCRDAIEIKRTTLTNAEH